MRELFLSLILFVVLQNLNAQSIRIPVTSSYVQLGAYSNLNNDVFSFAANQAALASSKKFSAGIFSERRFMLQELSFYNAAVALPVQSGAFGISTSYFGNNNFNEAQIGFAYGRRLSDQISIGVQFNYFTVTARGYGNASSVNFEVAALFRLTENLTAGIHTYNPASIPLIKNEEEKLAAIYHFGLGYDASEKYFISAEIGKTAGSSLNINTGMQYKFNGLVQARIGVETGTSSFFFGIGVSMNDIRLDVTTSLHPQLGATPGLSMVFNKK